MDKTLLLTDLNDLAEIVRKAVEDALEGRKNNPAKPDNTKDWLTLKDAAKYLHISRPTFIAIRKKGAFEAHHVGNRHLFCKADLDRYIQSKHLAA
jgi:excisionase family DNA binding protein